MEGLFELSQAAIEVGKYCMPKETLYGVRVLHASYAVLQHISHMS